MPILDSLGQDLRFGLRWLVRRPGYAAAAMATMAVGIGATIAIFTVVHGVLLEPLPLPAPARLVRLFQAYPERGYERVPVSQLDVEDWARNSHVLQDAGVYSTEGDGLTLTGFERPEKLATAYVSGGLFPTLGLGAELGRTLGPADAGGTDRVVVLSHAFWQRRFAGDPSIVGQKLTLNGEPMTVVGVMPAAFRFPSPDNEVWPCYRSSPKARSSSANGAMAQGRGSVGAGGDDRRRPGGAGGGRRPVGQQYPDSNEGATAVTVLPLQREMVAGVRPALLLLFAAVGALLLIACVSLAGRCWPAG